MEKSYNRRYNGLVSRDKLLIQEAVLHCSLPKNIVQQAFDRFGAQKNAPPHFDFKIKLSDSCQKCWSKTFGINKQHV